MQHTKRQAVAQIALDDPDAGQRTEQKQGEDAQLAGPACEQPSMGDEPALGRNRIGPDPGHRIHS